MKTSIKEKVKSFPQKPGVYRFYDSNSLLYIGKAKNLRKRASSYFNKTIKEYKTSKLIDRVIDVDFLITKNETEALLLEQNLINLQTLVGLLEETNGKILLNLIILKDLE